LVEIGELDAFVVEEGHLSAADVEVITGHFFRTLANKRVLCFLSAIAACNVPGSAKNNGGNVGGRNGSARALLARLAAAHRGDRPEEYRVR
jgi:hypothetical protein